MKKTTKKLSTQRTFAKLIGHMKESTFSKKESWIFCNGGQHFELCIFLDTNYLIGHCASYVWLPFLSHENDKENCVREIMIVPEYVREILYRALNNNGRSFPISSADVDRHNRVARRMLRFKVRR